MAITKDEQRFYFLSICTACLVGILGICLYLLFQYHTQNTLDTEKNTRLQTLQKTLSTTPEESSPSNNPLAYLKECGGESITKITQDKYLNCELNCSYTQLLYFLQKYAAAPAYIQSLQILRDKTLLVTIRCDALSTLTI